MRLAILGSCMPLVDASEIPVRLFSDIPVPREDESENERLLRSVVYSAAHQGIVSVATDGTFRPDAPVTRAEALKILLLAFRVPPLTGEPPALPFSDVPYDAWFAPFVERAWHDALLSGYPDGTFKPDFPLSRAEAATVFARILVAQENTSPKATSWIRKFTAALSPFVTMSTYTPDSASHGWGSPWCTADILSSWARPSHPPPGTASPTAPSD